MRTRDEVALESVFPTTRPPPSEADLLTAEMLLALGVSSVYSAAVNPASGVFLSHWHADEHGYTGIERVEVPSVEFPMGTVQKLRSSLQVKTDNQCVNPRRWELAWRLPNGRLGVASVRYRLPRKTLENDNDLEQLKELCGSGLTAGSAVESISAEQQTEAVLSTEALLAEGRKSPIDYLNTKPLIGNHAPAEVRHMSAAPHGSLRWFAFALLLLGAAGTALFLVAGRQAKVIQEDMFRHRIQAESTMSSRLSEKLAQGDYGEVQAELDSFQALESFEGAVVTNAQQRVVAMAGRPPGVRIGDPLPLGIASTAKVTSLGPVNQRGSGQAMTWGFPGGRGDLLSLQSLLLDIGAGIGVTSALVAIWLALRMRQRSPRQR